ncbi:MAG: response regulator transcription factor [Bacteroidia bacterium]
MFKRSRSGSSRLRYTILLVEPNANMRSMLTSYLQKKFKVVCYGDGMTAIAGLRAGAPVDAMLVSDSLHQPSTSEWTQAVKASGLFGSIPVVCLSKQNQHARKKLHKGADVFLTKPFNPEKLEGVINQLIRLQSVVSHG